MKYFILPILLTITLANKCTDVNLGSSLANPAASCHEIYRHNPTSRDSIGQYWIQTANDKLLEITCNMKLIKCGGVKGGQMQVVDADMN